MHVRLLTYVTQTKREIIHETNMRIVNTTGTTNLSTSAAISLIEYNLR